MELKSMAAASFRNLLEALLVRGFRSSKCKTEAKLAVARIKLLRNRREGQIRQMRRDVASLLANGQDSTARIRVEHVIREQNIMAANEIIQLFCELVVLRLPIIAKQRECPADLKEGISSLIFSAPRCSEIPELTRIRDIFEKKYGKDFVSAATDLRPNSGVNCMLVEKLSVRTPTGQVKLKIMKEIAKEFHVEWDTTETELELLNTSQVPNGPRSFNGAAGIPVKSTFPQQDAISGTELSEKEDHDRHLKGTAASAEAVNDLAERAAAVAQAAAELAKQTSHQSQKTYSSGNTIDHDQRSSRKNNGASRSQSTSTVARSFASSNDSNGFKPTSKNCNQQNHARVSTDEVTSPVHPDEREIHRNENYYRRMEDLSGDEIHRKNHKNSRKVDCSIQFDDSDGLDSDSGDEFHGYAKREGCPPPPNCPPPLLPSFDKPDTYKSDLSSRVHPKLPDYDKLSERFEALKMRRFS